TFIAGAAITIIVGWFRKEGHVATSKDFVLVLSAVISLFAALSGLFDLKDKASSYDILTYELRQLRSKMAFAFHIDPPAYPGKKEGFFNEFQRIMASQKSIIENSYI